MLVEPGTGQVLLTGTCSCPIERDCLHAVALALAAVEDLGALDDRERVERGKTADREPERFETEWSSAVASWLRALTKTVAVEAQSTRDECVVYVLNVDCLTERLTAEPKIARLLKSGDYGTSRSFNWRQLGSSQAGFTSDHDRSIARMWIAGSSDSSSICNSSLCDLPMDAAVTDLLLKRMIATGRCFWGDSLTIPLTLGAAKEARLDWRVQTDGKQKPQLICDQESLQILRAASPWYVDTICGEAGPLSLPLPLAIVQSLCAAPFIAPKDAERLSETLQKMAPTLSLPLPVVGMSEEIITEPPVVRLTLKKQEFEHKRLLFCLVLDKADVAVLSFDYGFDATKLDRGWERHSYFSQNRAILRKRDPAFERGIKQRLAKLGFTEIGGRLHPRDATYLIQPSEQDWLCFVQNGLAGLRAEGWQIAFDPSFQFRVTEADGDWSLDLSDEGAGWWFSLDMGIDVGGKRVPLLPILTEVLQQAGAVKSISSIEQLNVDGKFYAKLPQGGLISLPFERVKTILGALVELFDKEALAKGGCLRISIPQAIGLIQSEEDACLKWSGAERLRRLASELRNCSNNLTGIETIAPPNELSTRLRPYQSEGLSWLQFLAKHQLGGILADDMGLGKTVQTLAHILIEKQEGRLNCPCLIVCPTSVIPNWIAEAKRFAPTLEVLALKGSDRSSNFKHIAQADLVLTTYPLLCRDGDKLCPIEWHAVILDEAQAIKNPTTQIAKTVAGLRATHRICLTGTPIENHLGELWSQFNFLMPGMLGDLKSFNRIFRTPIEKESDDERRQLLSTRLHPFILRRTKDQRIRL